MASSAEYIDIADPRVQSAVIDLVNPRLARYPRGFALAILVVVVQAGLLVGLTFYYRETSGRIEKEVGLSQYIKANNVAAYVKVCQANDKCAESDAQEPFCRGRVGAYVRPCLLPGFTSCDEYHCGGLPVFFTDQNGRTVADQSTSSCQPRVCRDGSFVSVAYYVTLSWKQSFINALATTGTAEVIVTLLVVSAYKCCTSGAGWMRKMHEWEKIAKVAAEDVSSTELAAQRFD
mmetsp:Transcript_73909/g.233434  ORF Transcript_73909/g.233434 Transcript_73909/m.233434 type:complete len:233 (-) Transcript_73909:55-753(-)